MGTVLHEDRLQRLIAVGRSLVSELDLDTVLVRLLEVARELTGARYAALGVLDRERREIERFLTCGIDPAMHRAIGDPPRGHGILGLLIEEPRPLRLHDLREHPCSYGFPAEHPPMSSFLGVPIVIRGRAWGNLYLTEKQRGDFDAADEETALTLASWAAIAIENARLHRHLQERHDGLARTVRNFEATATITRAVGAETDLTRVLELIVKRGRALVDARALLILLRDGDDLSIAAAAGEVDASAVGRRIPVEGTTAGTVLRAVRAERSHDVARRLRVASDRLGVPMTAQSLGVDRPRAALVVPLEFHGRRLGVLLAFDRLGEQVTFDSQHQALLLAFAASGATAVATAQSVERQRLRDSMTSAELERQRWARELHDETLQALAGFRVLIDATLEQGSAAASARTMHTLGERVDAEIDKLRTLIAELRPAALDEQGLRPALEQLADDVSRGEQIEVDLDVRIDPDAGSRLAPESETAVYRVVQEALANTAKHAHASHVAISIVTSGDGIDVTVRDDGAGFDPEAPREGYGITGMYERAELADGTLAIASRPGAGTTVHAWMRVEAA